MWRTPRGERALSHSEGELIRELVGYIYDQIDVICDNIDFPYEAGVDLFDRLAPPQQLALLNEVGTALLSPSTPSPELTAIRESTVMVLFRELRSCLDMEIDSEWSRRGPRRHWRRLLRQVYLDHGESLDDVPNSASTELSEWARLVDVLAAQILWDADWDMEELFVDEGPETASYLKKLLRIPDNYFRAVAPDPTASELNTIRHQLNELTGTSHSIPNRQPRL